MINSEQDENIDKILTIKNLVYPAHLTNHVQTMGAEKYKKKQGNS